MTIGQLCCVKKRILSMKYSGLLLSASILLAVGVMSGCATDQAAQVENASATSWVKQPVSVTIALGKPYTLQFDKMAAKLTPQQEEILTSLALQMKDAKSIILRGYCNKRDIGNAKDSALARAVNVQKFLVSQGIADQKMSLRYNTDDAEHAVELELGN
jgi:outer membrane protein OmpA-like peptidoglycan-associated protein